MDYGPLKWFLLGQKKGTFVGRCADYRPDGMVFTWMNRICGNVKRYWRCLFLAWRRQRSRGCVYAMEEWKKKMDKEKQSQQSLSERQWEKQMLGTHLRSVTEPEARPKSKSVSAL